jgi:prepilin-type N-terminal cleavage/methylation domain-containing protein
MYKKLTSFRYKKYIHGQKGFTLAEILVVITVIGCIASLTIPPLVLNIQKQGYVTGLKKTYSVLASVGQLLIEDNGSISGAITSNGSIMNALKSKLNVVKFCAANTLPGECWHDGTAGWKDLHGDPGWTSFNTQDRMILSDGSMIALWFYWSASCTATAFSSTYPEAGTDCGAVIVDINGFKAPNQAGRDIFMFNITQIGIFPNGFYNYHGDPAVYGGDWFYCNPIYSGSGNAPGCGCGARILKEGGMNY